MASPGEDQRVGRGDDRIKRRDRSGEWRSGGVVDGTPQDRERQGADGEQDDKPLLQHNLAAVRRIDANAACQSDKTVVEKPAGPLDRLSPIRFHQLHPCPAFPAPPAVQAASGTVSVSDQASVPRAASMRVI